VVLRIFITLKNPSPSVGIEPANLGSSGEHANLSYLNKVSCFSEIFYRARFQNHEVVTLEGRASAIVIFDCGKLKLATLGQPQIA
jgi:hypothetical protein